MDIKDYIHFYLGHECMVDSIRAKIQSVGCADMGEDVTITYENMDEESGFYGEWIDDLVSHQSVKPILRNIESMTEEEAMVFFELPPSSVIYGRQNMGHYIEFTYKWENEQVKPETWDGWCHSAVAIGLNLHTLSFHVATTKWLIDLGFDLFGLIDAGLAIDADTLTKKTTT